MRIIRTIIFCAGMVVYSSTMAQASVNNNQIGGLSNNPDATLIEKNQNRFEFGPQTLSLELPDAGSVSVKNFPKLASVHFLTESNSLQFNVPAFKTLLFRTVKISAIPKLLVHPAIRRFFVLIIMLISKNAVTLLINIPQTAVLIRIP